MVNRSTLRHWFDALAAAMVMAAGLSGCDATRAPGIAITEARVVEQVPEATLVYLTLELTNANSEPLPLVEFRYQADLDGRRVFESRRAAQATLRRLGTQTLMLPVVIPADRVDGGPAGSALLTISGRLLYIAPGQLGEVLFDTGVRVPKVSFSESVRVEFGPATKSSRREADLDWPQTRFRGGADGS